ncbi:MAG: tyrosine-protein phosphatase [Pseudomonadales bacterium]|nr:tyrosine-protein phosphatase [Pseudomonadales bacterium]
MPSKPVPAQHFDQYHILSGSMPLYRKLIERGELNTDTAHQTFVNIYKKFAHEVATPFCKMFPLLIKNSGQASLFHCSAGKDRTGIAAALILSALDVPRDTIIEDYLLTAQYMDTESALDMIEDFLGVNSENTEQVERDWLVPIVSVHEDFIGSFFTSLENDYGSVDSYLNKALALSPADIQTMRDLFLEN